MNNISFKKVNPILIEKIKNTYKNYVIKNIDDNKVFVFNKNGTIITIYKTNSVLFQGFNFINEARNFFSISTIYIKKNNYFSQIYFKYDVIGNDEVGVGDIFGPVVVTAVYIPTKTFLQLKTLPIKDSKKMTDKQILFLAPIIKKMTKNITIVINNKIYNQLYCKYKNANVIKALAHNKALVKLITNYNLIDKTIFIDKFVSYAKYFEYLKNSKIIIKNKLIFIVKGEEKSLAIACSAIISRAVFLNKINYLSNKYNIILPLGANENVKMLAKKYKENISKTIYINFLKDHFNLKKK